MNQQKIFLKTEQYVKEKLDEANNGRDWWHVYRVRQTACHICKHEPLADLFVVELASLLHDMAHWQLTDGNENHGPYEVERFLASLGIDEKTIAHVLRIIRDTKFKGATNQPQLADIESKIVYDADKLDSLGAIGIAKTFTYGGATHRPIHDPVIKPM